MKVLPVAAIRPINEGAFVPAIEDVERLSALLAEGAYLRDGGRALYVYEFCDGAYRTTGVAAQVPMAWLASRLAAPTAEDNAAEGANVAADPVLVDALASHLLAVGAQPQPVPVRHAPEPVLDIILGAVRAGAPLYTLENGSARLAVWEARREDSVGAITAMLERMDMAMPDPLVGTATLAAATALRDAARQAGTYAGSEPFNWALVAFSADPAPLPANLIMHGFSA